MREKEREREGPQQRSEQCRVVLEPIVDVLGHEHAIDVAQLDAREHL
jgi:hypothetical protein